MRFLKSIGVVAVYFGILLATLFVVGLQDNLPGLELAGNALAQSANDFT